MFFQHMFPISEAPLVVINGTSLSTNDSKIKYRKYPSVEITDTKHKRGRGVEVEGDLKQSVNYQLKDFFSFCQ